MNEQVGTSNSRWTSTSFQCQHWNLDNSNYKRRWI